MVEVVSVMDKIFSGEGSRIKNFFSEVEIFREGFKLGWEYFRGVEYFRKNPKIFREGGGQIFSG